MNLDGFGGEGAIDRSKSEAHWREVWFLGLRMQRVVSI